MSRSTKIDWSGFSKLRNDDTLAIVAAVCKSCAQIIHSPCTRTFQSHRNACKGKTSSEFDGSSIGFSQETMETDNNNQNIPAGTAVVDDIWDKYNSLNQELAKFFFTGNIPFRQVENPYLSNFIKMLLEFKIDFKPPSRISLGNTILQSIHKNIIDEKKNILNNTDSILLVDGWRNKSANKKYLVFSLKNANTPQTFLTFFDTSSETEHGENLALHINEAIIYAKNTYNTHVYAIITDNDSKIKKGAQLSCTVDIEKLWQNTCASHSGNLLLKSLVDNDFASVLRDILAVFREPKFESYLVINGGTKLQNYPETRFCYFRDTCESIKKNLVLLRSLCAESSNNIKEDVADLVSSVEFENSLKNAIELLDPVCKLINQCQSPDCNAADATEMWVKLKLPVDERNLNSLVENRIKTAIWDVGYAANLMHHKYNGKNLNEDQKKIAEKFLHEKMNQDELNELNLYSQNKQRYEKYKNGCTDPLSYWNLVSLTLPKLARFAIKLMLVPASTALLEGLFSSWSYVHNIYRNRLANEKSAALLDIYHHLHRNKVNKV